MAVSCRCSRDSEKLQVVFGNRRLKALQDASHQGLKQKGVDCIVHDCSTAWPRPSDNAQGYKGRNEGRWQAGASKIKRSMGVAQEDGRGAYVRATAISQPDTARSNAAGNSSNNNNSRQQQASCNTQKQI